MNVRQQASNNPGTTVASVMTEINASGRYGLQSLGASPTFQEMTLLRFRFFLYKVRPFHCPVA